MSFLSSLCLVFYIFTAYIHVLLPSVQVFHKLGYLHSSTSINKFEGVPFQNIWYCQCPVNFIKLARKEDKFCRNIIEIFYSYISFQTFALKWEKYLVEKILRYKFWIKKFSTQKNLRTFWQYHIFWKGTPSNLFMDVEEWR